MSRSDWKQWRKGKRKVESVPEWKPSSARGVMLTASEMKRRRERVGCASGTKPTKSAPQRHAEYLPALLNRGTKTAPGDTKNDGLRPIGLDSQLSASLFPPMPASKLRLDGVLHFDGSANPNPGPDTRCAFILKMPGGRTIQKTIHLGQGTCNTAEYHGIIEGMKAALSAGVTHLEVYGDSKLVIEGVRKMRPWAKGKPHLEALKKVAQELVRQFERVELIWVPREENAEADALSVA